MRLLRLYRHFQDDAYKNELLVNNFPLVYARAKRYYSMGKLDDMSIYDDFVQEGAIGFINGLEKFDATKSKKAKVSTYCVFWIDKYIAQYIIEHGMLVRYTSRVHRAFSKFRKFKDKNEFMGMEVPFDVAIGGQRAERLGVIDLMRERVFIDVNNVEVTDMEYIEGDANDLIGKCEYLNSDESAFALTLLDRKSENGLTIVEKKKLKGIIDKINLWNNRKLKHGMKITHVVANFNKLVALKVEISDAVIESLAENVYHLEKDKEHKNDPEKAAEMRGIIRGMQLMRDAINNAKTKK